MKKETLFLILLIFSLGLLAPLAVDKQTVNVQANQKISVVFNLHNPTLQFTTDKTTNMVVNISMIEESGKLGKEIVNEKPLENTLKIDDLNPGLYEITFMSSEIVRVEIQGKGLYLASIIIIGTLLVINLILWYFKYND